MSPLEGSAQTCFIGEKGEKEKIYTRMS